MRKRRNVGHDSPHRRDVITLALIEDDHQYRTVLAALARHSGRYRVISTFETAEAAMQALPNRPTEVAIVDIGLPGRSGIEAVAHFHERCPAMRCVVLTASETTDSLFAALEAGACGYLLKTESPARILAGLDDLVAGGSPLSPQVARHVVASFRRAKPARAEQRITEREKQIMDALARGYTYKEIGKKLGISAATVKNHLYRIYEKLEVRSRTEAVVKWLGQKAEA
jgi:RNA polymerase sigma factor (sigma-70 family)